MNSHPSRMRFALLHEAAPSRGRRDAFQCRLKFAVQVVDPLIVIVLAQPASSHPPNEQPAYGIGVNFTVVGVGVE